MSTILRTGMAPDNLLVRQARRAMDEADAAAAEADATFPQAWQASVEHYTRHLDALDVMEVMGEISGLVMSAFQHDRAKLGSIVEAALCAHVASRAKYVCEGAPRGVITDAVVAASLAAARVA